MNKVKNEDIKALIPDLKDEDIAKLQQLFDRNFSEIVNKFETDIFDIYRIPKESGQKYYEYLKTASAKYLEQYTNKEQLDKLTDEVKNLKLEKTQLEEKIKAGTTGKTKEDLDKLELELKKKDDKITELQGQMKKASEQFETEKTALIAESKGHLKSLMLGSVKEKYKITNEAIPEALRDVIYRDIEAKLNGFEIKLENNTPVLYKDGQLQYSAKNPLEVLSLDNFYKEQLLPYGTTVITGIPGEPAKTGTGVINGAKTKHEAVQLIDKHLGTLVITKNSENYNAEFSKIANETKAFDLPA